jgi:hypothetical protein
MRFLYRTGEVKRRQKHKNISLNETYQGPEEEYRCGNDGWS